MIARHLLPLFAAAEGGIDHVWLTDLEMWSGVVFLIIASLLAYFAGPPMMAALRARERQNERLLHQAEIAERELDQLRDDIERQQAEHRKQALILMEEAERDAERTRHDILARAGEEADRLEKRIGRDIDLARQAALAELYTAAVDLSTQAVERYFAAKLSVDEHQQLAEVALQRMADYREEVAS